MICFTEKGKVSELLLELLLLSGAVEEACSIKGGGEEEEGGEGVAMVSDDLKIVGDKVECVTGSRHP